MAWHCLSAREAGKESHQNHCFIMNSYHTPGARHLITRFLTFSIAFSVFVWLLISCNKDMGGQEFKTPATPALSIEEARQFFSSKIPPRPIALRDDSLETESKPIEPNWAKAFSYYDEVKKQSVVEVALFDPRFSRILYNPDNTTVDTAVFSQNPQNNRLIIVKDSTGTIDYAIMKIDGAYSYNLGAGLINSSSYEKIDEQFTGFISYVDINDLVKAQYYVEKDHYVKIDSTAKTNGLQGELQERWELICITVRVLVPCNCVNHTDPDGCTCEKNGGDHHGPYWEEYRVCYDVNNFNGELPAGYTPGTPVYNPNPGSGPVLGNGGGTTGNPNSGLPPWPYQSWVAYRSSILSEQFHVDLLTDYEDIAQACASDAFTQEAFTNCVIEEISEQYFNEPPPPEYLIEFPDGINNCFSSEQDCPNCYYIANLYLEQPVPGTREIHGGEGGSKNGGHAFMSLSQYNPNHTLQARLTFGHYPFAKPHGNAVVGGGFFEENSNTVYNIRVSYPITYAQLQLMNASLSNHEMTYQVGHNNCTTTMVSVFGAAGINLPECPERDQFPYENIESNPGDLGEELRGLYYNNPNPPYNGVFSSYSMYQHLSSPLKKCD